MHCVRSQNVGSEVERTLSRQRVIHGWSVNCAVEPQPSLRRSPATQSVRNFSASGTRRTLRARGSIRCTKCPSHATFATATTRTGNRAPIWLVVLCLTVSSCSSNQRATEEIRVFHSAQCICDMGTKTPALCSFKSCGICCIVKSSFNEFAFGEKFNSGRYVVMHIRH